MRVTQAISIAYDELEIIVSYHALNVVLVQFLPVVGLMIVDGCDGVVAEHPVLGY
jgi:hypothetical protein